MDKRLVLPCLKGFIGSWTTYNCMMRLSDIANLVNFAEELHKIEKLSDKIQRELSEERAIEISNYLLENRDRFFNSLVVAIYNGDPNWHEIGGLSPKNEEAEKLIVPEYAQECLGFLSLTKKEKLFALDGQHRLFGIKRALESNSSIGDDLISVIIVTHSNKPDGIVRTRRLFTTLNKKAKLVSKDTIIALDEDDISACITRKLIENNSFIYFNENNISFSSGPVRDKTSITSIVNVYDNIQKLIAFELGVKISSLDDYKFKDHEGLYDIAQAFFESTFEKCLYSHGFNANKSDMSPYRNNIDGGHLLFRPIGWDIYTDIYIYLRTEKGHSQESAIELISKHDLSLSGNLFSNKVWSLKQRKILKVSKKNINSIRSTIMSKK
ncbi:DGQHR domain-containing protein [Aeromonas hydrophila]|nr:DGQHR domain-containing protein [Aeromonas hydrophila]